MRKLTLFVAALCLGGVMLAGCNSNSSGSGGSGGGGTTPVTLTARDVVIAPSTEVVQMSVTVNQVNLVRTDGTGSVNILSTPTALQFPNSSVNPVVLSLSNIPNAQYSSAQVSVLSVNSFFINTTGTTLSSTVPTPVGDVAVTGGTLTPANCAPSALCKVASTVNQPTSFLISLSLNLTGTPINLLLDINPTNLLQSDYSATPNASGAITVATGTGGPNPSGNLANIISARGQITALNAAANQFTMTQLSDGLPVVITSTNSPATTFTGFPGGTGFPAACTGAAVQTFSCLAVGQNVSVNYGVTQASPTGSTATNVTLETTNTASTTCNAGALATTNVTSTACVLNGVQGVVTKNNGTTFTMIVTGITATQGTTTTGTAGPPEVAAISAGTLAIGTQLTVTPCIVVGSCAQAATFGVLQNVGGLGASTVPVLPVCAVFTSIANIGPGQTVLIDIPIVGQTSATVPGVSQVNATTGATSADAILLVPSQLSGTLTSISNPTGNNPTLTLAPTSALYTAGTPAVPSVSVLTGPVVTSTFQGLLSGAVTGTNLTITEAPGPPGLTTITGVARVSGLQYNSCSPPTIAGANTVGLP